MTRNNRNNNNTNLNQLRQQIQQLKQANGQLKQQVNNVQQKTRPRRRRNAPRVPRVRNQPLDTAITAQTLYRSNPFQYPPVRLAAVTNTSNMQTLILSSRGRFPISAAAANSVTALPGTYFISFKLGSNCTNVYSGDAQQGLWLTGAGNITPGATPYNYAVGNSATLTTLGAQARLLGFAVRITNTNKNTDVSGLWDISVQHVDRITTATVTAGWGNTPGSINQMYCLPDYRQCSNKDIDKCLVTVFPNMESHERFGDWSGQSVDHFVNLAFSGDVNATMTGVLEFIMHWECTVDNDIGYLIGTGQPPVMVKTAPHQTNFSEFGREGANLVREYGPRAIRAGRNLLNFFRRRPRGQQQQQLLH